MPMPRWVAEINKRVFNKMELKRGQRPVLTHIGRSSGASYRTPLDVYRVENGLIFMLVYGSDSDWVQNVLDSGSAKLELDGETFELASPRVIAADEAWSQIPSTATRPRGFLNITEYLQMDIA